MLPLPLLSTTLFTISAPSNVHQPTRPDFKVSPPALVGWVLSLTPPSLYSCLISEAESARLYMRTSSIEPKKYEPPTLPKTRLVATILSVDVITTCRHLLLAILLVISLTDIASTSKPPAPILASLWIVKIGY